MTKDKESKENCIFCKILEGTLPVSMICEDQEVAVFVDIRPIQEGHLLIIPKYHAPYMKDVDPATLQHMMVIAAKMNQALRKSDLRCEGVNLLVADGEAARQEVFHFHLHVFPRYKDDGFGLRYDPSRHFLKADRKRMDEIAAEIKRNL
ncbi:HIT family protein [Negadavirga shengliensis]|uniref:HIT family protein n=1 Tax=Negadavirga shengliensis TaxID=1389218 RepID=A0ABV9T5M8_9BACT